MTESNLSPELAELLRRLEISPPLLINEDALTINKRSSSKSSSDPPSIREADDLQGYPERLTPTDVLDRKILVDRLLEAKEDGKMIRWRNNSLHEILIEHFKKKQMLNVYGDESEDDPLEKKYRRKLGEFEKLKQEIQASEEERESEASTWSQQLQCKTNEADTAVEEMASKERAVGTMCRLNGKPFSAKRVEALISRQLAKIKEIAKFRVRYACLRDILIEKETTLSTLDMLTPHLDKKDYERLETESFCYQHELANKEGEIADLVERRDRLSHELKTVRRKRKRTRCEIVRAHEILERVKATFREKLRRGQIRITKLKITRDYVEKFENAAGPGNHPELLLEMESVSKEHEEWLRKISKLMKQIKGQKQCLNALRANFILHDKSKTGESSDDEENVCAIQRSSLPPVGGGFLQALHT